MSNQKDSPVNQTRNIVLIAAIVVIAVILILVAQWSQNNKNGPTQEEISQQIAALATATPAPAATPEPDEAVIETASPVPESMEASSPEPTAQPTEEAQTDTQELAEAYLFIIVNNRVQGIYALGEEGDVTVDQGDGVVNVIHMTENGFYMASSTCDNQLCVGQGEVTVDNYQRRILGTSILCLPHNLDLELVVPSHTPDPNAPDI